jgi:hypothetical protein
MDKLTIDKTAAAVLSSLLLLALANTLVDMAYPTGRNASKVERHLDAPAKNASPDVKEAPLSEPSSAVALIAGADSARGEKAAVPGSKMAFTGAPSVQERAALLACLRTLSADPKAESAAAAPSSGVGPTGANGHDAAPPQAPVGSAPPQPEKAHPDEARPGIARPDSEEAPEGTDEREPPLVQPIEIEPLPEPEWLLPPPSETLILVEAAIKSQRPKSRRQ